MRGETRRKARRCIHRRSIAARIAAKTTGAASQGAGERPSPRAPRRTPEGAKRGFVSGRSRYPPKRSGVADGDVNQGCGTFLGAADSTGPRPAGVYVYAKRPRGRRRRPLRKASTVARNKAARCQANQHSTGRANDPYLSRNTRRRYATSGATTFRQAAQRGRESRVRSLRRTSGRRRSP